MGSLLFPEDHDRIADIWGFDDDLNFETKNKFSIKSKKKMRKKKTATTRLKTALSGKSKTAIASREKVYDKIESNKSIKGKRGRTLIKGLAKKAYKDGNPELSRGLWSIHTRRSAFAAGVKAALSAKGRKK